VASILAYLYRQRLDAEMRERRAREAAAQARATSQSRRPAAGVSPLAGGPK
jgi:hypothetical protein